MDRGGAWYAAVTVRLLSYVVSEYQTVIILGAPRSGTNMLRDVLCRLPGFATWPCDEINPLWRTGNSGYPSDALPTSRLTPRIQHRIRAAFNRQARSRNCKVLVEKTCASCLRPEFVNRCFPGAKFVQIVRDPVDTTSSTLGRWNAPLDPKYLLKKARFVPLRDLPRTATRALLRPLLRGGPPQHRPWGPVLPSDVLPSGETLSASAYAALQWIECVARTDAFFAQLAPEQACSTRYEDFVVDPEGVLMTVLSQLGFAVETGCIEAAVAAVHCRSVGRGRGVMDAAARIILEARAISTMHRHGYAFDVDG